MNVKMASKKIWKDLRCPECGSASIHYYGTSTTSGGGYGLHDGRYVCEDCGYTGPLVLDVQEEEEKGGEYEKESDSNSTAVAATVLFLLSIVVAVSWGLFYGGAFFVISETILCVLVIIHAEIILPGRDINDDLRSIKKMHLKKVRTSKKNRAKAKKG